MAIDKKAVGQRIKLIRQTKGMTLEAFGKLFEASKGNVSLWERGSSLPSNERIKKISQVGNMSVDELLHGYSNIKKPIDEELSEYINEYVDNKNRVLEFEVELFTKSMLEGALSVIGLGKGLSDEAVKNYEKHNERINELETFAKNYIKTNYENYTYDKYLQNNPNSNLQSFKKYKEKEWDTLKQVLDNFWEAFDIPNQIDIWISNRFTDQIRNELTDLIKTAVDEKKEQYYVNEVVQPFLDQAAKDFKEYIKQYRY